MCCNNNKLGLLGCLIKFFLGILNTIFLLVGGTLFALGAILKWTPLVNIVNKVPLPLFDLSFLNTAAIAFLVVGAYLIVIGFLGLIGTCCTYRVLLIIYEVLLVILLIAHVGFIIFMFTSLDKFKDKLVEKLDVTIVELNVTLIPPNVLEDKCRPLRAISDLFKCCGASGPSDFLTSQIRDKCCNANYQTGCVKKVSDRLKEYVINIFLIPNIVVCVIELAFAIAVIYLIVRLSKSNKKATKVEPFQNQNDHQQGYNITIVGGGSASYELADMRRNQAPPTGVQPPAEPFKQKYTLFASTTQNINNTQGRVPK